MFQFKLHLDLKKSIRLEAKQLTINDSLTQSQFTIEESSFVSHNNNSMMLVNFHFKRIFSYHLTNTYLPTISLLVISQLTLFFDDNQTEMAIGLSLTIMLVMYTLYQSINAALTMTAYLKMIDIWLLFCLFVPFIIFLIEVSWLFRQIKRVSAAKLPPRRKSGNKMALRVIVPGATIIFVFIYAAVAAFKVIY